MTSQLTDWTPRARRLAVHLLENGDVRDAAWVEAVAAVPRHELVPAVYQQDVAGTWQPIDVTTPEGLDLVYSPTTLITALVDRGTHHEAISSSTKPDLMVRMLELLDVHDGHRALEIGTGTGYNAALLAHRLGDDRVFSVDVDSALVDPARERLAAIGYRPTLVTADGAEGLPEHAPYDRIIATCSVPAVPYAWADQLTPSGKLLVDLKVGGNAGNLALLQRQGDGLEGHFTDRWASFMTMRHPAEAPASSSAPTNGEPSSRTTPVPPNPWWDNRVVWFLAQFTGIPAGVRVGAQLDPHTRKPTAGVITAPDGSKSVVALDPVQDGRWTVTESGPTPLWAAVEHAYDLWNRHGCPDWSRLGVTVAPGGRQWVWIDTPSGPTRWELQP